MAQRLVDLYRPGDRVDLYFADETTEEWRAGQVLAHQFPGVWVQTADRRLWFVTNGKRIRLTPTPHPGSS